MSTIHDHLPPSPPRPPAAPCATCHFPVPQGAQFCGRCGCKQPSQPLAPRAPTMRGTVIEQGEMVPPGEMVSAYPAPAAPLLAPAPLRHISSTSAPLEQTQRLELQRRPVYTTAELLERGRKEQHAGYGLFRPSGPLPPIPALDFQPPSHLATPPLSADSATLPTWLSPALKTDGTLKKPEPITPSFLQDQPGERKSGPAGMRHSDDLVYVSDPTLLQVRAPKLEDYGPQPDGKVICSRCWAVGICEQLRDGRTVVDVCPLCKGEKRIPAPNAIPQPLPDARDAITAPPTPEETAMVAVLAGFSRMTDPSTTGPTDVVLEAVKVDMPANTPMITMELPETPHTRQEEQRQMAEQTAVLLFRRTQCAGLKRRFFEFLTTDVQRQIAKVEEWRDQMKEVMLSLDVDDEVTHVCHMAEGAIDQALEQLHDVAIQADFAHGWLDEVVKHDDKLIGPLVKAQYETEE